MRHFTNVHDLGDLKAAVKEALEVKSNRFAYKHLGQDKTLMMIFFNSASSFCLHVLFIKSISWKSP